MIEENRKLANRVGDGAKRETDVNMLAVENVQLRKSMGNWEDWIRKFNKTKDELTLATAENARLRAQLSAAPI